MKKPNIPMCNPITTCRQKVNKKKYDEGYERIFGALKDADDGKDDITYKGPIPSLQKAKDDS